jgi:PTS system N-acetylgalactosamine-specific IIA component
MSSSVRAIVAAHGQLAQGLVSAVDVITGRGASLRALSNAGMPAAEVATALGSALDETGAHVVFTDLPAGSCTLAARRLQRDRATLTVVIGVNLPMLLEFVLRDGDSAADVAAAVDRGKEHVRILAPVHVG